MNDRPTRSLGLVGGKVRAGESRYGQ